MICAVIPGGDQLEQLLSILTPFKLAFPHYPFYIRPPPVLKEVKQSLSCFDRLIPAIFFEVIGNGRVNVKPDIVRSLRQVLT
jgi:hypothetical protein